MSHDALFEKENYSPIRKRRRKTNFKNSMRKKNLKSESEMMSCD